MSESEAMKNARRRAIMLQLGIPEWQIDMALGGPDDTLMRDIVADGRAGVSLPAAGGAAKVRVDGAPRVREKGDGIGGWVEARPIEDWRPPGLDVMDRLMDAEDAVWRAERAAAMAKRGGGKP